MEQSSFSLAELQNWMQGMLVRHVAITNANSERLIEAGDVVNASTRLSAISHLNIYRHSYIARLRACMQTQFSTLAYALGSQLFELFADQYLDTYPSASYTLNTLGEKFSAFLEQTRPDKHSIQKETWPDFMIELAAFEYALTLIFDEQTDERIAIVNDDTPDELLKLTPVFHLFKHHFPICRYYLDFTQNASPELPFPEESFCAITRKNYKLGLFSIKKSQYYFLESMQRGNNIEEAKNDLVATFNINRKELDAIWYQWKKNFIDSGFFCQF